MVRTGRVERSQVDGKWQAINIYLASVRLETADKFGDGNVSEGIRLALAALRSEKTLKA